MQCALERRRHEQFHSENSLLNFSLTWFQVTLFNRGIYIDCLYVQRVVLLMTLID